MGLDLSMHDEVGYNALTGGLRPLLGRVLT